MLKSAIAEVKSKMTCVLNLLTLDFIKNVWHRENINTSLIMYKVYIILKSFVRL